MPECSRRDQDSMAVSAHRLTATTPFSAGPGSPDDSVQDDGIWNVRAMRW